MSEQQDDREEAIRAWKEQADATAPQGRRFSGERLRRIVRGDRLAKAAFIGGTGAVLFFVFNHDTKEQRLLNREARAAMQLDEPSVRDFRPPVMPTRLAAAADVAPPSPVAPKPEEKAHPQGIDAEAAARRRRDEQLAEARTKSDIVVRGGPGVPGAAVASATAVGPETTAVTRVAAIPREAGQDPISDPNTAFARQASGRTVPTSLPVKRADLRCAALQGKMIDAELETAINTDLPGQIRAIVSSPLYAEQGREPLLTSGSRLIGVYNAAVRKGQVRVFAIWNRAIRPDGVVITLDSHAADALGRSGMMGETDNHFVQVFGTSLLLSIIGAGASTVNVSSDARPNSVDEYRRQVQQSFGRTADRLLEPFGNIPPTNSIRQGERIKVFLNRDLDFCPLNLAVHQGRELVLP